MKLPILAGGPLMWAIALIGIAALIAFLERSLHLHRARINWRDFLNGLFNILARGNIDEALSICADTPGPVSHIARTAIKHRQDHPEALRSAIVAAGEIEIARLRRRFVAVAVAAQIAPVLGLLGTIIKMAEGLIALQSQTPLVQRIDVFMPLMQALMYTAAGLIVAAPCYLAYTVLVVKLERIVLDMQSAAAEILAHFLNGRGGGPEKGGAT